MTVESIVIAGAMPGQAVVSVIVDIGGLFAAAGLVGGVVTWLVARARCARTEP